jgi:hypothetical protein
LNGKHGVGSSIRIRDQTALASGGKRNQKVAMLTVHVIKEKAYKEE